MMPVPAWFATYLKSGSHSKSEQPPLSIDNPMPDSTTPTGRNWLDDPVYETDSLALAAQPLTQHMRNMTPLQFLHYAQEQVQKRVWSREEADHLRAVHAEWRRAIRVDKITDAQRSNSWKDLYRERTKELQSINARLYYQRKTNANPKLRHALELYDAVLKYILTQMNDVQARYSHHGGRYDAVNAYNKDRVAAGKKPLPNHGAHWHDWVSPKARREVIKAFDEAYLDKAVHAKWRHPFIRRDHPLHDTESKFNRYMDRIYDDDFDITDSTDPDIVLKEDDRND